MDGYLPAAQKLLFFQHIGGAAASVISGIIPVAVPIAESGLDSRPECLFIRVGHCPVAGVPVGMFMAAVRNHLIAQKKIIMPHTPDTIPNGVIPGDVHMIPVSVNGNHAPGMAHAVAGHQFTGNIQFLQNIRIGMGIPVADCQFAHQRPVSRMGIAWNCAVLQPFLVIFTVQNQIIVNCKGFFHIAHGIVYPGKGLLCCRFQFFLLPKDICLSAAVFYVLIAERHTAGIVTPPHIISHKK